MKIVFLGTAGMVPTKERNVSGIYVEYSGLGMLFDCGEGTQRQMNIAGLNRNKVKHVFVTHWHGDHVSGLVGLIQTVSNQNADAVINIYGPEGTKEKMMHTMKSVEFESKIDLKVHEIKTTNVKKVFENEELIVNCAPCNHTTPALAYSLIEKDKKRINVQKAKKLGLKEGPLMGKLIDGKSIVVNGEKVNPEDVINITKGKKLTFIMDTSPGKHLIELAQNSDLLICESTFAEAHSDRAEVAKHMTATNAAMLAEQSNSKKLILTHFSQRYRTLDVIEEEATTIFQETELAYDFMKINL